MPLYNYQAKDKNGKMVSGSLESASKDQVIGRLQTMGFYPMNVSEILSDKGGSLVQKIARHADSSKGLGGRIKSRDITGFTRQLADLLSAGLTLTSGLGVLVNQTENIRFREVIRSVRNDVQGGGTLAEALAKHTKVFPRLYCSMVRAGEVGGMLEVVLSRLAEFQEKEDDLKGKIIGAMAYPMVMIFVGFSAIILLMTLVIPRFVEMFQEMGVELPLPTRIMMDISGFVTGYWYLLLLILVVGGIAIQRLFKTEEGRRFFHRAQLKLPVLGPLILKREIARFARTFGELLTNGVNILQALQISSETMNNQIVSEEIAKIKTNLSEGEKISDPLRNSEIFPPVVVNMIAVGEESGQLEEVLNKIAISFEADVDRSVKIATSLLEPAVILFMGILVGVIAISMLLPVFAINAGLTK